MAVSQEDIVRKVQALWAKADDPAATTHEKVAATDKARELMAKHAIDEIVLEQASATHEVVIISDFLLWEEDDEHVTLVPDQRMKLAHYIAIHNRCKGIMSWKDASVYADGSAQLAGRYMLVFGFKSDVELVRLFYQTLVGDMFVAFHRLPKAHIKRQKARDDLMANFCDGYADRIGQRFAEVNREVHKIAEDSGSLLPVLRSREVAVLDKFDEMFPPNEREQVKVKGVKYDPNARAAGAAAANQANIGGTAVGGGKKGELGQ